MQTNAHTLGNSEEAAARQRIEAMLRGKKSNGKANGRAEGAGGKSSLVKSGMTARSLRRRQKAMELEQAAASAAKLQELRARGGDAAAITAAKAD